MKKKKKFMDPLALSGGDSDDSSSSSSSSSDEEQEPAAKKSKSDGTTSPSAAPHKKLDPDPSELNLRAAPSLLAVPDPEAGNSAQWAWKPCSKKERERDRTPTRAEREATAAAATLGVDSVAAAAAAAASRAAALRETLRREKQERDAAGRLSTRDKEARKRSEGAQQKRSFVEDEKRRAREAGGFD